MLKNRLQDAANNIPEFMFGNLRPFGDEVAVKEDIVYACLIQQSESGNLAALAKYVSEAFKGFLPGGKHCSPTVKAKTISVEKHTKKKVREKSRECHNHKPQPFQDTKRKRKQTNPNKHKSNKRTKNTKIGSLFPKRGNRNAKRTEKHKNKMTHITKTRLFKYTEHFTTNKEIFQIKQF